MKNATTGYPFRRRRRTISRYDFSGHYIDSFESLNQAQRELTIPASSISLCVNKKTKTAGGFIWRFGSNKDRLNPTDYESIHRNDGLFQRKPVNQYDKHGKFIKRYVSVMDASQQNGILKETISQNALKKVKTSGDFTWRYGESRKKLVMEKAKPLGKPVSQFTQNGEFIKTYPSIRQAGDDTNISKSTISVHLRGKTRSAGGFIWQRGETTKLLNDRRHLINHHNNNNQPRKYNKKGKLQQYDTSGHYINTHTSLVSAEKTTGVSRTGISKNLNGILKSTGGFIWQYGEKQPFIDPVVHNKNVKPKPIDQFTKNGEKVASYPSVFAAAKATKQDRMRIRLNAMGKIASAGDFIWKYVDQDQK